MKEETSKVSLSGSIKVHRQTRKGKGTFQAPALAWAEAQRKEKEDDFEE